MTQAVHTAFRSEFRSDVLVLDIGDIYAYNDAIATLEPQRKLPIYTFGGMIGEIILVFTAF